MNRRLLYEPRERYLLRRWHAEGGRQEMMRSRLKTPGNEGVVKDLCAYIDFTRAD